MGMRGAYDAHFHCDVCKVFWEADQVDTASQARKQMRDIGWKLLRNGAVICPNCDPQKVMPEHEREGGDWRIY